MAPPVEGAGDTAAFERKPTDINFVRSRMLYARATLNARGLVYFGLRHIRKFGSSDRQKTSHEIVDLQALDALNRFPVPTGSEDSLASRNGNRDNSDFPGIDNTLR